MTKRNKKNKNVLTYDKIPLLSISLFHIGLGSALSLIRYTYLPDLTQPTLIQFLIAALVYTILSVGIGVAIGLRSAAILYMTKSIFPFTLGYSIVTLAVINNFYVFLISSTMILSSFLSSFLTLFKII